MNENSEDSSTELVAAPGGELLASADLEVLAGSLVEAACDEQIALTGEGGLLPALGPGSSRPACKLS